jgi:hypothetical protein
VGEEDVRGRSCYVLDVPAPEGAFAGCSGVRLWIEPRIPIMLRAEAYDQQDALIRRMEVKSFKKINDRWVIKDIELTSLPSRHKTYLRVRDVQDRSRKDFIAADEGGPEATPRTGSGRHRHGAARSRGVGNLYAVLEGRAMRVRASLWLTLPASRREGGRVRPTGTMFPR